MINGRTGTNNGSMTSVRSSWHGVLVVARPDLDPVVFGRHAAGGADVGQLLEVLLPAGPGANMISMRAGAPLSLEKAWADQPIIRPRRRVACRCGWGAAGR